MKRFMTIMMASIMAIACLSSCNKRRHNPEPTPAVEPTEITTFNDGGAYFYGQPDGFPSINMFCVYLLNDQTRIDDRVISGVGSALWLDMNVAYNTEEELAVGTYGPARNDFSLNSFLKGQWLDDNTISGSYIYYRDLNGKATYHMISNGSVTVNKSGGKVSIKADVIADGVEYNFDFFDFFSYTDVVPSGGDDPDPDPQPATDYTINDMKYGRIEKEGKVFDNHQTEDYCVWKVLLGTDTSWAAGKEVQWEIVTTANATDIVGSYTVAAEELNDNTIASFLKAGAAFCGYTENNSNGGLDYYGSWFYPSDDDSTWLGATEGTVDITKSGSTYTVTFSHKDRFNSYSSYSGKYTGTMEVATKAANATPRRSTAASAKGNARVKGAASATADRRAVTAVSK